MKVVKDQDEYEDVVDAKCLLHEQAAEKFQTRFAAARVKENDAKIEEHRETDPKAEPAQCFARGNGMRPALEDAEVQREHRQDKEGEASPKPDGVDHKQEIIRNL